MGSFQLERLIAGILAVAGSEDTISLALKYMEERSAFNKPLNKFQVLRHKLVDLITETEVIKQFVYHCCWLQANGHFAVKECSMAKLKATELSKTVVDECLQVFGGYGYMSEYPIERAYRDARIGTIVAGTSEIMKEIIAKTVIDKINYESTYETMRAAANQPMAHETPKQSTTDTPKNTVTIAVENPTTAREILYSLPSRLRPEKLEADTTGIFHFKMDGEGDFTITLKDGVLEVEEGLIGEPSCEIKAKAKDYVDIELGKTNPQMAFMMGKIKISNIGLMMKFMGLFKRLSA
jgi:acyl-CoA dehydrogenase